MSEFWTGWFAASTMFIGFHTIMYFRCGYYRDALITFVLAVLTLAAAAHTNGVIQI